MLHTTYNVAQRGGLSCESAVEHLESYYEKSLEEYGKDTPIPLSVIREVLDEDDFWWVVQNAVPGDVEEELSRFLVEYLEAIVSKLKGADLGSRMRVLLKIFVDGEALELEAVRGSKERDSLIAPILKKYCGDGDKTE